ncbi:MAG: hypothetical protein ACE5E6_05045, partial [Phycisphaerae bacterium]
GCSKCRKTGFRGRIGIYEVMVLDAELKRMIHGAKVSETDIRVYLAQSRWRSLREKALELVEDGRSTIEEVIRVTRNENLAASDPTGAFAEGAAT